MYHQLCNKKLNKAVHHVIIKELKSSFSRKQKTITDGEKEQTKKKKEQHKEDHVLKLAD